MKNKMKMTNIALATGLVSALPYNVLAVEKESLLDVDWSAEFSEGGFENFESIVQTSDGGFVVAGEADVREEEGGSRGDAVIVKYDKNGKQEWYNAVIGEDTDLFYSVTEAKNGGFYAVGKSFSSDLGFANNNNISHAIIVKYDNSGNQEWIKAINDNGKQINYNNVITTSEGNLAIVGDKIINGSRTGFLMVVDENGNEVSFIEVKDGANSTELNSVIETKDGKFVVVGKSVMNSEEKPFISMVNKNGKKEWSYKTEDDKSDMLNVLKGNFTSVVQAKNGDIIVAGYSLTDNQDALIMTFDNDGERGWFDIIIEETSDVYTSVMINSRDEILVLGESMPAGEMNALQDLKVSVTRYASDYTALIRVDDLSNTMKNVMTSKGIMTSEDKIVAVGRSYKKVVGQDAKCDIARITASEDCIQADGIIMQISVKNPEVLPEEDEVKPNPCEVNEKPVIKADDITIYEGDEFKPFLNVTATDKENGDLTESIEITFNNVDVNKAGEYKVIYTVVDECGVSVEKERKVTVKAKVVDTVTNTEKPQTGDAGLVYAGLTIMSSLGLMSVNKKKED